MIRAKRVYEQPAKSDGARVLADRLWPRGRSKENAKIDTWLKDIAPSNELRNWFGHDPAKWETFVKRYAAELKGKRPLLSQLRELERTRGTVTLLYAAKDEKHNNAVALQRILQR